LPNAPRFHCAFQNESSGGVRGVTVLMVKTGSASAYSTFGWPESQETKPLTVWPGGTATTHAIRLMARTHLSPILRICVNCAGKDRLLLFILSTTTSVAAIAWACAGVIGASASNVRASKNNGTSCFLILPPF